MLNSDCFSEILLFLDFEKALECRLVCTDWNLWILSNTSQIAEVNDIFPAKTIRELITGYAHSNKLWRIVKSFSFTERAFYLRSKGKYFPVDEQYLKREKYLEMIFLPNKSSKTYKTFCRTRQIQETKISLEKEFSDLSTDEFFQVRSYIITTGKYSLLRRLYRFCENNHSRKNSEKSGIETFRLLVLYGADPNILEMFSKYQKLYEQSNRKGYLSFICYNQNEHLLKKRKKEKGRVLVEKKYHWKRGEEIASK